MAKINAERTCPKEKRNISINEIEIEIIQRKK
jgi:hypothetical protein